MEKQINFALVRFYENVRGEDIKTYVIPINDIEDFLLRDNYDDYPVLAWKCDKSTENHTKKQLPAQILKLAGKIIFLCIAFPEFIFSFIIYNCFCRIRRRITEL